MKTPYHWITIQNNINTTTNSLSFLDLFASRRHICTMMKSIAVCLLPLKCSNRKNNSTTSHLYKWLSLAEAYQFMSDDNERELKNAHDALMDSEACLKIFWYLVKHWHVMIIEMEMEADNNNTTITTVGAAPIETTIMETTDSGDTAGDLDKISPWFESVLVQIIGCNSPFEAQRLSISKLKSSKEKTV